MINNVGYCTLFLCFAASLLNTFSMFGPLHVEWPGKDGKHHRCPPQGNQPYKCTTINNVLYQKYLCRRFCFQNIPHNTVSDPTA